MDTYYILKVTVRAGSRVASFKGLYGNPARLKLSLCEVAEGGKANTALIDIISKTLKVSKSSLSILRGQTSQSKDIKIEKSGQDKAEIVRIINNLSK